jgi:hypothetical protein
MGNEMMQRCRLYIRNIYLVLILFNYLFVFASAIDASAGRGIKVRLKAKDKADAPISEEVELYSKSYALIIGIDDYHKGWPRLSNAVSDAMKVADTFRKKGFDVSFKINLTSSELKKTFEEFFIFKGDDPNARLFIWFAGHGHTIDGNGFLVPTDAPSPEEGPRFKYMALSMRRFGEFVRLAKSKHTLAIFDSCFSGTIFSASRSLPPVAITRMTTFPVRQFLTSGDSDQTVSDDGRFCKLFLRAVNGEDKADFNEDGYVTGSELGLFITNRITNLTLAKQTPRYGKFLDEDFDRGDFVFVLPEKEIILQKSIVSIESNVSGAKVLVDGKYIGRTNLNEAKIPPGKHTLKIEKKGYRAHLQSTLFKEGREIRLYIHLTPNPPPTPIQPASLPKAKLFVTSTPEDAVIRIENIKETFYQGISLSAGRYLIVVEADGHKTQDQWITLESGKEKYVDVELEWIEPPTSTVRQTPSSPPRKKKVRTLPPISF